MSNIQRDIERAKEIMQEVSRPYIALIVDLYSVSLPSLIMRDGQIIESKYSEEVEARIADIRKLQFEDVSQALRQAGLAHLLERGEGTEHV